MDVTVRAEGLRSLRRGRGLRGVRSAPNPSPRASFSRHERRRPRVAGRVARVGRVAKATRSSGRSLPMTQYGRTERPSPRSTRRISRRIRLLPRLPRRRRPREYRPRAVLTAVSKTATPGSIPGSPVCRTARKTTTFPAQASVSGPQRHLLRIRMDPHGSALFGGGRSLAGHLQRTYSGGPSAPLSGPIRVIRGASERIARTGVAARAALARASCRSWPGRSAKGSIPVSRFAGAPGGPGGWVHHREAEVSMGYQLHAAARRLVHAAGALSRVWAYGRWRGRPRSLRRTCDRLGGWRERGSDLVVELALFLCSYAPLFGERGAAHGRGPASAPRRGARAVRRARPPRPRVPPRSTRSAHAARFGRRWRRS